MLTVTLLTVAACSYGTGYSVTSSRVTFTPSATTSEPIPSADRDLELESRPVPVIRQPDSQEPRHDLYGNDVSDAIAKYKSDRAGSVYEEHAPQTEVPRLKHAST
jgi:hypothetical protein